jgi:hypothetical protein
MTSRDKPDLLDKLIAGNAARGGKGFRQPPTGKKAKARKHQPLATEKVARRIFKE